MDPVSSLRFIVPARRWLKPAADQLAHLPGYDGHSFLDTLLLATVDAWNEIISHDHFRLGEDLVDVSEMLFIRVRQALDADEDDCESPRDLGLGITAPLTSEEMDVVVEVVQRFYQELLVTIDLSDLRANDRFEYLGHPAYDLHLYFEGHHPLQVAPPAQQRLIRQFNRYHHDPDLIPERPWL